MRIRRAALHRMRCLHYTILTMIAILLPTGGFSQAARATSRIKKPLIYQIGNVVHINAEGPRPLLQALDALQEKYGWIVDYEDPQYPADWDLATNPPSLPPRRHANARNPGGEGFSVEFNTAPASTGPAPDGRPDEDSVLTAVVDGYNQSNAAGQFELRKEHDGRFEVVGVGVRGQHDEVSGQQPILDRLITLTTESRSAQQTILLICRKVSEQSKIPVTPSGIAGNFRGRRTVAVGGTAVPARTLLSRTLASTGDHLSWRLLYDASGKSYELNLTGLSPVETGLAASLRGSSIQTAGTPAPELCRNPSYGVTENTVPLVY